MILIAQLEIYKLLRHPLTWCLLTLSLSLSALLFCRLCVDHHQLALLSLQHRELNASLSQDIIKPLCSWMMIIFTFIFSLFTTFAFSQEYRQRSFYLFATSPVKACSLVLGKYLSLLAMLLVLVIALLMMISLLAYETTLDWHTMFFSFLALSLVTSCVISLGLFISSLFSIPLLAIGTTLLLSTLWLLLEWIDPFPPSWSFLAKDLSLLSHCNHLLHNTWVSSDLVFYCLFDLFWLTLCVRVIRFKMIRIPV